MSLWVVIELAGPPRGKARARRAPNGTHVYTDAAARKYESQLRYAATQVMAGCTPTIQPVRMEVEQRFPIAPSWSKKKKAAALAGQLRPIVKPDVDNALKLSDCLNQVVFADDKQIVEASVRKIYSEHPGLTIIVEAIEPPAALAVSQSRPAAPSADLFVGTAA